MPLLPRLINFLPVLALVAFAYGAEAQETSAWAQGHSSRVRLVGGGAAAGNQLAGVQIDLDPGFKTYWRSPGEAGLPPTFDWSKSVNVESAEVLWPAPSRFEDPGGIVFGYQGGVLFPVRIRPQDPSKPVGLALRIDYAVCKDICIPAQAELSLKLPKTASNAVRSSIETALARVPRPPPLGADGELSILGAEPTIADGKPRLAVTVRAPVGAKPTLFVEPPENWFLLAAPQPLEPAKAGTQTFLVDVLERPADASGPIDLRLTLVAGDKAVETTTSLDAAQLTR